MLFSELINLASISYYTFIEFFILLYTFLVISFAWYKEYNIGRISFDKFSDVLTACTCARVIGYLLSICLGLLNSKIPFKRLVCFLSTSFIVILPLQTLSPKDLHVWTCRKSWIYLLVLCFKSFQSISSSNFLILLYSFLISILPKSFGETPSIDFDLLMLHWS